MSAFICPSCERDVYPITLKVIKVGAQYWHEICFEEDSDPRSTPSGRPVSKSKDDPSDNTGLDEG